MQGTNGFGAYVHWPFCLKKCPYCDFNSHVSNTVDHAAWRAGFLQETEEEAARVPAAERQPLDSVFFGGGTPSLMEPKTVATILEGLDSKFGLPQGCEITLEANPTSVEADKLAQFKAAGVNRVSLGVQSLRDDQLHFLGRQHSAREALAAVEIAGSLFDRFSFDLIYARPGQSLEGWREELEEALAYAGGHLSLYQLTIEQGTQFETLHGRGAFAIPDDDLGADLFELTQEVMEGAGLPAYEVSNHAKLGEESRHNMIYWQSGDWLGLGPGAHGRLSTPKGRVAYRRHRAPTIWLQRHAAGQSTVQGRDLLSAQETAEEMVMMGLRTRRGINLDAVDRLCPDRVDRTMIPDLVDAGLLTLSGAQLGATEKGFLRVNAMIARLLK